MQRLVPALLAAPVLCAAASAQSFNYPDFTSTAGLNLVLQAGSVGNVLRVHDQSITSGGDNMGAAWYATPVAVVGGFDTTFTFNINGAGNGDGMALVIQNDQIAGYNGMTGNMGIGRHASACGYGLFPTSAAGESLDNSLAIEIDHFFNDNQPAANPILDPDGNHVSVHTGGSGENQQIEAYSIGRAPSAVVGADLDNGTTHTMRVLYVPGTLEVYLNGSLIITAPYDFGSGGTWIDSATPVGGMSLIGGTSAYVGFTASGGGNPKNHDVLSWSWDSGTAGNMSLACDPANNHSGGSYATLVNSSFSGPGVLHLEATDGPQGEFAYFLVSSVLNDPGVTVSNGMLCLGAPTGRYAPAAGGTLNSIGQFDASGVLQNLAGTSTSGSGYDVLPMLPSPPGGMIMAGETWYFQCWYRDGQRSNFSNALCVTF